MIKNYAEKIRQWAKDRKIIPNSNLEAQNLKLAEEFGELADSFRRYSTTSNKDDKQKHLEIVKDSIGDVFVVVSIIGGLIDKNIEELPKLQNDYYENKDNLKYSFMWLQSDIGDVAKSIVRNYEYKMIDSLANIVNDLQAFCKWQNIDFIECVSQSWNEIKNRKGYLNENGIFVKEADINSDDEMLELERENQIKG